MDGINHKKMRAITKTHNMCSPAASNSYQGRSNLDDESYRYLPPPIPYNKIVENSVCPTASNYNNKGKCSKLVSRKHNENVRETPHVNTVKSLPKSPNKTHDVEVTEEEEQFMPKEVKAEIDKFKDEFKSILKVSLPDNSKKAKRAKKQITQDLANRKCLVDIETIKQVSNYAQQASVCFNAWNKKYSTNLPHKDQSRVDYISENLTNAERLLSTLLEKQYTK